mmetsp:Transcript_51195/g.165838  ORF Transcript_51195/g.165838 Transcript_51195/m.165838 type:complete len:327 (-) Transcript_51195:220-1200(-)
MCRERPPAAAASSPAPAGRILIRVGSVVGLVLVASRHELPWLGWFEGLLLSGPRICEDLGHVLPEELQEQLRRPFSAGEAAAARQSLGLASASRHGGMWARCKGPPTAVWLVRPSAAGKSSIAEEVAVRLGIPMLSDSGAIDAVTIDGEAFRARHAGFRAVVADGLAKRCTWREAYPALRPELRRQKVAWLQLAMTRRQNLLIPHTCQVRSECWSTLDALKDRGYMSHVVLVLGRRGTIQRRGLRRARRSGKRYAPQEWDLSIRNGLGLVARADGYAELVWTTPHARWLVQGGRPDDVLHATASVGAGVGAQIADTASGVVTAAVT